MATKGFTRKFRPLEILAEEEVEAIHRGTLEVLWVTGVRMEHERALKLFEKNGCKVDHDEMRVRIPQGLVEECLRKTPSNFHAPARDPKNSLMIGGNTLCLAVAPGQQTVDLDTWEPRPATRKENYDGVTILDALPTVHFFSPYTPYFGFEHVPPCMAMLESLAARIRNSTKFQCVGFSNDSEIFAIKMARAAGIEILGTCAIAPPLSFYRDAVESAFRRPGDGRDCARYDCGRSSNQQCRGYCRARIGTTHKAGHKGSREGFFSVGEYEVGCACLWRYRDLHTQCGIEPDIPTIRRTPGRYYRLSQRQDAGLPIEL